MPAIGYTELILSIGRTSSLASCSDLENMQNMMLCKTITYIYLFTPSQNFNAGLFCLSWNTALSSCVFSSVLLTLTIFYLLVSIYHPEMGTGTKKASGWKELLIEIKTIYYLIYQSSVETNYTMKICTSPLMYGRNISAKLQPYFICLYQYIIQRQELTRKKHIDGNKF